MGTTKRWAVVALLAVLGALAPMLALAADTGDGTTTPVDSLSDYALWAIVGGALTSVVTAVINRSHWRSDVKLAVFFLLCCLTAAGDAYWQRELDFANWSRALLLVVAAGWTTYAAARPAIKTIEAASG